MHCQLGQVERAVERSGEVGKGSQNMRQEVELSECKARHIQTHVGRQDLDAEQSNGKVS